MDSNTTTTGIREISIRNKITRGRPRSTWDKIAVIILKARDMRWKKTRRNANDKKNDLRVYVREYSPTPTANYPQKIPSFLNTRMSDD